MTEPNPISRSRAPVFILTTVDPKCSIEMNLAMAEQLVDLFDACREAHITIEKEMWAFYKQLENFVGPAENQEEKDRSR